MADDVKFVCKVEADPCIAEAYPCAADACNDEAVPQDPAKDSEAPHTTESAYWGFLDKLEGDMRAFLSEARAGDINKAANARARKLSLNLRKSLAEYRSISVAHDRTHGRKSKADVALDKDIENL